MKHINQKSDWDCAIAAVAMFAEVPYLVARKTFEKLFPDHNKEGFSTKQIMRVLKKFGMKPHETSSIRSNSRGVMFLPSLNEEGSHCVYYQDQKIYDPNYKLKGKKYHTTGKVKCLPYESSIIIDLNESLI